MKGKKSKRMLQLNLTSRRTADRATGDSWQAVAPGAKGKLYGARWRRERLQFLNANPLCVRCLDSGRITSSCVVDHIRQHGGDVALFWNRHNWQALCKPCHDSGKQRDEWNERYGRRR